MKTILLTAEHELRTTGKLSDATCRAFANANDNEKRGFEASFAFLGCPGNPTATYSASVTPTRRINAIRLMMLRLQAHTDAPRWSSHVLDDLFDAALRPPAATIGDVVQALFHVLAEAPPGLSRAQANFIREVAIHVVGKQRHAYASEDFSWLATNLIEPLVNISAAQAYLAAYTLPVSLIPKCRDSILGALQSTLFEDEVKRALED